MVRTMNRYLSTNSVKSDSIFSRNIWYILIIFCVVIVIVAVYFFLLPKASVCGNKICENENCFTCREDCKCPVGKYCSEKTNTCIFPRCGNDICEPFETSDECCRDCECWHRGEVCNKTTNKCEVKEVKISDERAKELVSNHFKSRDKNVTSMEVIGPLTWEKKYGIEIRVYIDEKWFGSVLVTEEEIIELPRT